MGKKRGPGADFEAGVAKRVAGGAACGGDAAGAGHGRGPSAAESQSAAAAHHLFDDRDDGAPMGAPGDLAVLGKHYVESVVDGKHVFRCGGGGRRGEGGLLLGSTRESAGMLADAFFEPTTPPPPPHTHTHPTRLPPYSCTFCEFSSRREYTTWEHVNSAHLSLLPYACEACSFKTANRRALVHHAGSHHPRNVHFCQVRRRGHAKSLPIFVQVACLSSG